MNKVSPVSPSLSLPATAHMTEAAVADYTFSCDGNATPPTPFSFSLSVNLFPTQSSQLTLSGGLSSSFMMFCLFSPGSPFPLLLCCNVPSPFCSLNVQCLLLFAKQLLPVSKHSVHAASYSVTSLC